MDSGGKRKTRAFGWVQNFKGKLKEPIKKLFESPIRRGLRPDKGSVDTRAGTTTS